MCIHLFCSKLWKNSVVTIIAVVCIFYLKKKRNTFPSARFSFSLFLLTLDGTWNISILFISIQLCAHRRTLPGEVLTVNTLTGFNLPLHSAHRTINVFIYLTGNSFSCDAQTVSSYSWSILLTSNCLGVTRLTEKCLSVISTMTSLFYEGISDHLVLTASHLLVKSGGKRIDGYSNCVLVAFML